MTKLNLHKYPSSQITPEAAYTSRRRFLKGALLTAGAAMVLAACQPDALPGSSTQTPAAASSGDGLKDELGNPATAYDSVINYNNYYEFTTDKPGVARLAKDFITSPWKIEVGGLVRTPKTFDIDDLRKFDQEERIYRMRCVEGWSMVIPWLGFPLSRLLQAVEPTADAKYVRFQTVLAPTQMPGQRDGYFPWPYVEGLRLDEAMHPLTLLATGVYGKTLLPQMGAPIRLVVPWKYGFKSIKSIVKIDLVTEMPTSLWMKSGPNEYGFYANVNPQVSHPRWSQSSERRIGDSGRIETLMFNGYDQKVASLYAGLDLKKWF